ESDWATFRLRSRSQGGSSRSTFAAGRGGLGSSRSRSTHERRRVAPAETYPDDLRYHPEHDWARIEGDEAVFGVTWFAQDALGEPRSEEHTSELQSRGHLVCRLLLEKKKIINKE